MLKTNSKTKYKSIFQHFADRTFLVMRSEKKLEQSTKIWKEQILKFYQYHPI